MPDIVLHLSTQAAVHNLEGALAAEKLGFTRIILSREALLGDIEKIRQNTSLEIEVFVQALYVCLFRQLLFFFARFGFQRQQRQVHAIVPQTIFLQRKESVLAVPQGRLHAKQSERTRSRRRLFF